MSKLTRVALHLLGAFAVEANAGRTIPISVRSKKARALLAYLAMKPDYRASREELATLLWGDNPDAQARHSLRQCISSLRHDLCFAPDILIVERDVVGLRPQLLAVDARTFVSLARSKRADELAQAVEIWRGEFLADLVLDIEEFDTWQHQERDRLAGTAADLFEALCRNADADGDSERALAAAERLVALEPAREDRQRTALKMYARYKGREAALKQAKLLTDLLRTELSVSPEAATRALIDAIRRGDLERRPAHLDEPLSVESVGKTVSAVDKSPPPVSLTEAEQVSAPVALVSGPAHHLAALPSLAFLRRRPIASIAAVAIALVAIPMIAVLELADGSNFTFQTHRQGHEAAIDMPTPQNAASDAKALPKLGLAGVVVLPFAVDTAVEPHNTPFARALTHNLIAYLARFGQLRVISERTSDLYRDRRVDVAKLGTTLGVRYAIVGHVQSNDRGLRVNFQLVDTATRLSFWSDHLQRERGDPSLVADEVARGIARALAIEISHTEARRLRDKPSSQLAVNELVERGYLAQQNGAVRKNLSEARALFEQALQRDPHYQPALLAVARVHITAAMNFVDLDPPPDLKWAERLLNESLARSPNSLSAHYSLGLLQRYRRQYQASMQSLQRCLELNPSFLPAQGQIGNILTRIGEPQKGLEQIQQTIRAAIPNDPTMGYWYLFAAEAELELGHDQAALDWALRANAFMPGSPLVHAWLASIYATAGDEPNAAKYVTELRKMAPDRTRLFTKRFIEDGTSPNGGRRPRIFDGLRLALSASLG
jgi:DNA-binding SARP family transcriptional activator/TolB-like protein